jgi:hypothetical protein
MWLAESVGDFRRERPSDRKFGAAAFRAISQGGLDLRQKAHD